MIQKDFVLNLEFGALELICYLMLGIWCFFKRHALCSLRYANNLEAS